MVRKNKKINNIEGDTKGNIISLIKKRDNDDSNISNVDVKNTSSIETDNIEQKPEKEIKTKKSKKTICRIVVATPSYFVVQKNDEIVRVNNKNNYKRGDEIIF